MHANCKLSANVFVFFQERLSMIGPEEFIQAFCKERVDAEVCAILKPVHIFECE